MPLDPVAAAAAVLDAVDRAVAPVLSRLAVLDATLAALETRVRDVAAAAGVDHDRIVALEGRAAPDATGPFLERLAVLETRLAAVLQVADALATVRERVAGLEARPPVPGPAGADGPPGRDGVDGLGFDDVAVAFDGDRTLSISFQAGDRVRSFPVVLPVLRYQGVWREDVTYTRGDVVTWAGSAWYCEEATTTRKPATGARGAWTLVVKCGRDGRDGAAGPPGPAGPAGRDWQQLFDASRAR